MQRSDRMLKGWHHSKEASVVEFACVESKERHRRDGCGGQLGGTSLWLLT